MARPAPIAQMSYAEYLALEAKSDIRHEFLNGEVFAMPGATLEHARLAAQLVYALIAALAGKPCQPFTSDARVRIPATGLTTYPDLTVVCGGLESDAEDNEAIVNPRVIIEVLSESTEAYDRGAKASHYRQIPTLSEYVLVSQAEPRIEVQRRNDRGIWEIHEFRAGDHLELTSLGVSIDLNTIDSNPLPST